jgi:uncharacterized protein YfiM (DUF2279 family)
MRELLLIFSLNGFPGAPAGDRWFSPDKLQHFFSSAFVQSIAYGSLRGVGASHGTALAGASVTTAAVGVGKEIHDARSGGDASARDLAWDAAGAGAMTVLLTRTAR